MNTIKWYDEVLKRKEEQMQLTKELVQIKSVLKEQPKQLDAPLGNEVKEALQFMLTQGQKDGFITKNVDNLAGHLEFGTGEELVGILCHVDVVPEGDGWTYDPFGGEIVDGKMYGRGVLDDKGPTIAAYMGMKIVKELGLPLSKRVRMIIGTDEESDWRCVDRYFKTEEMPTIGFAPDADFPIIYAEKGIADYDFIFTNKSSESKKLQLVSFQSGRRYNMVPDYAKAIVKVTEGTEEFLLAYENYLSTNQLEGKSSIDKNEVVLELVGISAHGMEPNLGKNAGIILGNFLANYDLDSNGKAYVQFIHTYFYEDSRGNAFKVNISDQTGDLTMNVGVFDYSLENGGKIGVNMRYPASCSIDETMDKIKEKLQGRPIELANFKNSLPHYVKEDSELIQTLKRVYEEQINEKAELIAIGGGTYARSLTQGVAFGPLFPGSEDSAHQRDEFMYVDDLLKAASLYAQAIYELAK